MPVVFIFFDFKRILPLLLFWSYILFYSCWFCYHRRRRRRSRSSSNSLKSNLTHRNETHSISISFLVFIFPKKNQQICWTIHKYYLNEDFQDFSWHCQLDSCGFVYLFAWVCLFVFSSESNELLINFTVHLFIYQMQHKFIMRILIL